MKWQSDQIIHSDTLRHPHSRERERLTEKDKERQQKWEKRESQTLDVTRLVMLWWITDKAPKQKNFLYSTCLCCENKAKA